VQPATWFSYQDWILTSPSTALQCRWGGWYVTGNIEKLDVILNSGPYLTSYRDIVALLVIEYQVEIQNLITRVNYDTRTTLHNNPELLSERVPASVIVAESARQQVRDISEPFVEAMLMVNEVLLTDTITSGSSSEQFLHLSSDVRNVILAILIETKPEFNR